MIDSTKRIELKSPAELEKMRRSGILLSKVLAEVERAIEPGISTYDLDQISHRLIRDGGAVPAFLGYHGFPATLCTSVNNEIVHGIPNRKPLNKGDIVAVDCGLVLNGFFADRAFTAGVGEISEDAKLLLDVTRRSLEAGIAQMTVGNRIGNVSHAIQSVIEPYGFGIVRDYTGHGIGRAMHEPPQLLNFGEPETGFRLKAGLCIAIEPMVNLGTWKTRTLGDGWTVVTEDGSWSAHFEHTVAVTEDGPYILTAPEQSVGASLTQAAI